MNGHATSSRLPVSFPVKRLSHPEGIGIIQPSVAPKAFGATLGHRPNRYSNPERVGAANAPVSKAGKNPIAPEAVWGGCNPFRVDGSWFSLTLGNACLPPALSYGEARATQGWMTQSRWDCKATTNLSLLSKPQQVPVLRSQIVTSNPLLAEEGDKALTSQIARSNCDLARKQR